LARGIDPVQIGGIEWIQRKAAPAFFKPALLL
jgi:hypothetical protein